MIENKTIAILKLNRGAWMEFREKLIARFTEEKSLDTYSDEFVRKTDGTTYVVKIITVHPNFLDPLIGFENACDATDMQRFINKVQDQLREYTTLRVNADPNEPEIESTVLGSTVSGAVQPRGMKPEVTMQDEVGNLDNSFKSQPSDAITGAPTNATGGSQQGDKPQDGHNTVTGEKASK